MTELCQDPLILVDNKPNCLLVVTLHLKRLTQIKANISHQSSKSKALLCSSFHAKELCFYS